jgi:hypothetical protein
LSLIQLAHEPIDLLMQEFFRMLLLALAEFTATLIDNWGEHQLLFSAQWTD